MALVTILARFLALASAAPWLARISAPNSGRYTATIDRHDLRDWHSASVTCLRLFVSGVTHDASDLVVQIVFHIAGDCDCGGSHFFQPCKLPATVWDTAKRFELRLHGQTRFAECGASSAGVKRCHDERLLRLDLLHFEAILSTDVSRFVSKTACL